MKATTKARLGYREMRLLEVIEHINDKGRQPYKLEAIRADEGYHHLNSQTQAYRYTVLDRLRSKGLLRWAGQVGNQVLVEITDEGRRALEEATER